MIRTVPSSLYFPPDLTLCLVNKLAFLGNDQWMSHILTWTKAFQRRQHSTEGRSIIPGQALLYRISVFLFLDCISVLATPHSIHTPVLLPGKSPGQRSLVDCSPWGRKESDTTEQLHLHFSLSCIGEGNGNPLQRSCLENPRDGGAWWAAVYGVAQSDTTKVTASSSVQSKQSNKFILLWFIPEYKILRPISFEFYYLLSQALIHFSGEKINASWCRKCVHICLLHQISTVSFAFNCQSWNSIENILSKLVYQLSNAKYMLLQNTCPSVGRYLATWHNYWFPT